MKIIYILLMLFMGYHCSTPPVTPDIIGTWIGNCNNNGTNDYKLKSIFKDKNVSQGSDNYTSNNNSCSGIGTEIINYTVPYTTGNDVSVAFNSTQVTATELDLVNYSIYYIDKSVNPNVLYFGMQGGATDNGSTPANRFTALNINNPYFRQ